MPPILRFMGYTTIIGGIIAGIYAGNNVLELTPYGVEKVGFKLLTFLPWFISGIISALIFFALALIIDNQEYMKYQLQELKHDKRPSNENKQPLPQTYGNSKASIDKLKGFKI